MWKFANRWIEFAERGEKTGEAWFGFAVGVARELGEDEAGMSLAAACEGSEMGAAKRWKVAAEEMGLPGRPKIGMASGPEGSSFSASVYVRFQTGARDFAEDEGFAGLDADAGEVKLRAEASKRGFDEIDIFPRRLRRR